MSIKYLKLDNTGIRQEAATTIGGITSSGKLVELNEFGKLDDSLYDLNNKIKNSLEINDSKVQLVNDSISPGNLKYYGTDDDGIKGFYDLPSGQYWLDTSVSPAVLRQFDGSVWRWTGVYYGITAPANPSPGAVFINQTNGMMSYWDGTEWIGLPATAISYDGSESGLTSMNVQAAIDEISSNVVEATTTTAGVVRLATNEESVTGTDGTIAVTPAGVSAVISNLTLSSSEILTAIMIESY